MNRSPQSAEAEGSGVNSGVSLHAPWDSLRGDLERAAEFLDREDWAEAAGLLAAGERRLRSEAPFSTAEVTERDAVRPPRGPWTPRDREQAAELLARTGELLTRCVRLRDRSLNELSDLRRHESYQTEAAPGSFWISERA